MKVTKAGCDIFELNDNVIDGLDLAVFVENWLEGCQLSC